MLYLNPGIQPNLRRVQIPVVEATNESLAGYGYLVQDRGEVDIEIVRWPSQGWRPVDADSGNEGGTTEGVFISEWKGDVLYGRNAAVDGHYVLGFGTEPSKASESHARDHGWGRPEQRNRRHYQRIRPLLRRQGTDDDQLQLLQESLRILGIQQHGLNFGLLESLGLLGLGGVLGLGGAWLAVNRHLALIEPR